MLQDRTGQKVPQATFIARRDYETVRITTDDVFKGKTVVAFALPGAFTPTCSSTHVPRYNHLAPMLKQHGVDEVVCIAVNDGFVMNAWQQAEHAHNLTFLPDGNAEFTEGMGMLVDKSDLGFGKRSWRYSMLVRDGVIEKMFIEKEVAGDPFDVSDADTMLAYISPSAKDPVDVTIFTREGCEFCHRAKEALRKAGIDFDELVLNRDYSEETLRAVSGKSTVPQTFANGKYIGDSKATIAWAEKLA